LTAFTNATAQTIFAQLTYKYYSRMHIWKFFGGYSGVVAGKNIPNERGWHVGIDVQF
jgi:hypothetical protein